MAAESVAAESGPGEQVLRAARTYGAAADHYTGPTLSFWDRFGAATVSGWGWHPDQFWDIVLGSGYRATADALGPEQRDQVRARLLAGLRADGVTELRTDVVYGSASRPRE